MKKLGIFALSAVLLMSSCESSDQFGAAAGGGVLGAIFGSAIGGLMGGPRGADAGAAIGIIAGATMGAAAAAPRNAVEATMTTPPTPTTATARWYIAAAAKMPTAWDASSQR